MKPFSRKATYSATSAAFTPQATPTDVAAIIGSATKNIYVTKVKLSGVQTTAGINLWTLLKRSTASTGGTPTAMTAVPHDSRSPAASATAQIYTANVSPAGTLVGNLESRHVLAPAPASVAPLPQEQVLFSATEDGSTQPIVLRGVAELLALNFGGVAVPAGTSMVVGFEWYEKSDNE